EQNEIYQALINSVGTNVKLKYPRSGDYRSAFVLENIDDEPDNEAMVFYESQSAQSGESLLRLKVLDKYDGEWRSVYDLACVGSEVDSVSFANLGSSDSVDIIVRYSMLNQTEKSFSVLNYRDGVPVELLASSYSCLEVFDLNSDGEDELFAVVTDKANQVSNAILYSNSENGFERLSEITLGGGAVDYVSVVTGQISENTNAVFLDYSRGSGQYGTDVVYCYGSRMVNPDSSGTENPSTQISRFTNDYLSEIHCFDIDNDGYVEIPGTAPLPGYETLTRPEQLCAVTWYTVIDDNITPEHYGYYSSKYNYALLFPNRWRGVVSAVVNSAEKEVVFIAYNSAVGLQVDETTELMRIRAVDKSDRDAIVAAKDMLVLGENDDMMFFYSENVSARTGKLALTESELENCFIIL
ncbi:MAG: hypothetical protein ACI4Q4_07060, partial [Oscillospiraceae bacterium]